MLFVTRPFNGVPTALIDNASLSGSVSLSNTSNRSDTASSLVVSRSFMATGASFTGVTVMVTVAVLQSPSLSQMR